MRRLLSTLATRCILLALAGFGAAQQPSPQPTFTVLFTFQTFGIPTAITEVSPGIFLGAISAPYAVFSITAKGAYKNIYTFPPNNTGLALLGPTPALNSQGYGSAVNMGPTLTVSELFSVAMDGKVTTYPYNPTTQGAANVPIQHPDGHLYTTFGTASGGIIFSRMDYSGNPTPLYTFATPGYPASMFLGQDGNFYGLWITSQTVAGIYRITPAGSFSWVVPSLPANTDLPPGLVQADNGNLYGTTLVGGRGGSIYEVTLDGKMRTIYSFPKPEFGSPNWMIAASDGNLYGTAEGEYAAGYHGYSSIFRINPNTAQFETVYAMKDPRDAECPCRLTQGSDGKIYGIAYNGGTYGAGTVFVLDAGLPPPKPHVSLFNPAAAHVGQNVLLWGSGLLGATAVSFNGTAAASFGSPSKQGIWVEVPAGATSGPVTVTTPNGTYTTPQSFTILDDAN